MLRLAAMDPAAVALVAYTPGPDLGLSLRALLVAARSPEDLLPAAVAARLAAEVKRVALDLKGRAKASSPLLCTRGLALAGSLLSDKTRSEVKALLFAQLGSPEPGLRASAAQGLLDLARSLHSSSWRPLALAAEAHLVRGLPGPEAPLASFATAEHQAQLDWVFGSLEPPASDRARRESVMATLREALAPLGYAPMAFGSYASDMYTKRSDMDVFVDGVARMDPRKAAYRLADMCRKTGAFSDVTCIAGARVPIVTLRHKATGLACDLSFVSSSGVVKSRMLGVLGRLDARYRQVYMVIKQWASRRGLNNARDGTLNSYSYSLLLHTYMASVGVLPALEGPLGTAHLAEDAAPLPVAALPGIEAAILAHAASKNASSTSELLLGFVETMASLDPTKTAADPLTGRFLARAELPRAVTFSSKAMVVLDPAERDENTARSITRPSAAWLSTEFKLLLHRLTAPNSNWADVLLDASYY
jgi:hypothetical protein